MADEAASLLVRITGDASQLEATISSTARALQSLEKGGAGVSKAMRWQNAGKNIKDLGEAVDDVTKPLQSLALVTAAGGAAAAKFAIDFEDNFAAVTKTVEGTPEQLEKIRQGIIDLTTVGIDGRNALPMTTAELTALAAAGGQLGIETDNILEFTEVMAQLGTATNLVGEEGASELARFMNVMQESQGNVRNVGSAVVDLGNNFATTEMEIISMANRMGKYGNTVGISTDEVLGYSAALSSLGIEAQLGGSAIGRTWLSIETAVASGGDELEAFAKYSNKSAKEFAEAWETDASGAFTSLLEGLSEAENLTLALGELGINNTQDIQTMMALANGIDLVTEALGRSKTAYQENTALQAEFDAKAETTASKLATTKNNIVEAARSIGETMLPAIADMSGGVADFAKYLAGLDEGTQKGIVKVGTGLAIAGGAAKGLAATAKSVGTLVEGLGKIKGILPAGAGAVAGPIAATAAAMTALGVAGKVTYDVLYNNEYKWADGLGKSAEKLKEQADEIKRLNDLKTEAGELELIINSPESSTEQIETAKARIEEIAALLAETYHLNIDADTSDIDHAIDRITAAERGRMMNDAYGYLSDVKNDRDAYIESGNEISEMSAELDGIQDKRAALQAVSTDLDGLRRSYDEGAISQEEFISGFQELLGEAEKAKGDSDWELPQGSLSVEDADTLHTNLETMIGKLDGEYGNIYGALTDLQNTRKEYENSLESAASALGTVLASDLASGNLEDAEEAIMMYEQLGKEAMLAGHETEGIAQSFALAKNGFTEFDQAVQAGALGAVANDFIAYQRNIGESTETAVQGAALLKNGFTDVSQAISSVDPNAVNAVLSDMRSLGEAQGLDMTAEKLTQMAQAMGLIDESKTVTINAEGDLEIIDKAQAAVDRINSAGNVTLQVDADGNITVLETADEKLKELLAQQDVTLQVNADGNVEVLDQAGQKLAEIDGETGTVTVEYTTDTTEPDSYQPEDKNADANYGVNDSEVRAYRPEDKRATVYYTVKTVFSDVAAAAGGDSVRINATGTRHHPGGLAMVNDQANVADPRELIIDNGRAFIPEGRNVILPLSRGAKVYTAAQTKEMMRRLGIPRFASGTGEKNSDAFTAATTDLSHYLNTNAVTVTQELAKWVELSEQFKDNVKDVEDIEENIYRLTRERNEELNDESLKYIELRTAMNDWAGIGDDPTAAYGRIQARNLAELEAGRLTWEEYTDTMSEAGEALYDGRIDQSYKWLEHEREYNDMSADDYLAGLDRMRAYTEEYYAAGLIDHRTFFEGMAEIGEKYIDMEREREEELRALNEKYVDDYFKTADDYKTIRDTFNDWDEYGDNEVEYYLRRLAKIEKMRRDGILGGEEGWQEYMDLSMENYLNMYKAVEDAEQEKLDAYREFIDQTEQEMNEEIQALREDWEVEDRAEDLDDVNRLLGIYKNAATDQGRRKYEELLEQKKQLEREEQIYQMEQENNAALEALETKYTRREEQKAETLKSLRTGTFNIFGEAETISADAANILSNTADTVEWVKSLAYDTVNSANAQLSVLGQILNAIRNQKVSRTTYKDGRTITISQGLSETAAERLLNGTIVTGLGAAMLTH